MRLLALLIGPAFTVSAIEPTVKVLDTGSEPVGGERVRTQKWKLSVEGEYILKTIETSVFEEPDYKVQKVDRTIRMILRRPEGLFSDFVTEETVQAGPDEREEFVHGEHKSIRISGFGRSFEFRNRDLLSRGGGGGAAPIDVDRSRAGEVGPVIGAGRTFYFTEHKSGAKTSIHFRLEVIKGDEALAMLAEAGLTIPESRTETWSAELPVRKLSGEQDGADQPATAPESTPEVDSKPEPDSEGRSQ